jgi:hypothetical protein
MAVRRTITVPTAHEQDDFIGALHLDHSASTSESTRTFLRLLPHNELAKLVSKRKRAAGAAATHG